MTAITITELSREDFPVNVGSGTGKRRVRIYLRATTVTANETLDLSSTYADIADIEGIVSETDSGAVAATSGTWSTVTYTNKVAGALEVCFVCTLT